MYYIGTTKETRAQPKGGRMIKYKYKDLDGVWHVFKNESKAMKAYRAFQHENDLFNGCWFGDRGKYEKLAAYEDGVKLYEL